MELTMVSLISSTKVNYDSISVVNYFFYIAMKVLVMPIIIIIVLLDYVYLTGHLKEHVVIRKTLEVVEIYSMICSVEVCS